jgi:hypothetical protein
MAATIGKVSAVFTASTSGLTSGVSAVGSSLGKLEGDVASLKSGMGTLVAINVAQFMSQVATSVGRVVSSFVSMGQEQADVIDKTSKMAERLGMTYKEFSSLSLAADLAGVSMEQITAASTKADVALVRAAGGSKMAQAAFDGIGLSVADLQAMSPAERFQAISNAIAELPTPAARAEAAVRLFGRAGAELLPLFNSGADAINQATQDAQRFGLALTNVQGKNVEAMNDAFTRAQSAIRGVIQQVVAYLAPAIENVTNTFTDLIGNIGGANIGQFIGRAILDAAVYFARIADVFVSSSQQIWSYVSQVGGQWLAVFNVGQRVFSFLAGVIDIMEVAFGSIVAAFTGVGEALLRGAVNIADAMGRETPGLDSALAGLEAFNDTLGDGLGDSASSAATNFNDAIFGDTNQIEQAGQAIAGPWESMIQEGIDRAEDSINTVDEITSRPFEVEENVEVKVKLDEAVKGLDSRSREGIAEMFRLMRGQNSTTEKDQLAALERIEENTRPVDDGSMDLFDLAPAAGA